MASKAFGVDLAEALPFQFSLEPLLLIFSKMQGICSPVEDEDGQVWADSLGPISLAGMLG